MSFARAFRLVAVILGVVSIVLGAICVVIVLRTRAFLADSSAAPGEVIQLVSHLSCDHEDGNRDRDCTTDYAPEVRFTMADGREIVFVSRTASNPPAYAAGDRVEVRYRPNEPARARIDTVTGIWLGAIITGGLTLLFAAICSIWIVLAVRFRKF